MRRVERPDQEPEALRRFREEHPRGTWKEKKGSGQPCFKGLPENVDVYDALADAQHHLCAYCEIDIHRPLFGQVEHFVPEHLSSEAYNYALDFSNMLACCEGGTRSDIPRPAGRAVEPIPETLHCGQLKDKLDPRGQILDPRELPVSPCLWEYRSDGAMAADPVTCAAAGMPVEQAQDTVRRLGLDRKGLRNLRRALRVQLEEELKGCFEDEPELSDYGAKLRVAREQLTPTDGRPPAFWSCIRHWAGDAAEEILGSASPNPQAPETP